MKQKELITLIRDASKLSEEAETFLKENELEYTIFYSEKKDVPNIPVIYSSNSFFVYEGNPGFHIFKISHQKSGENKVA